MIRTIIGFIYLALYLLYSIPILLKVINLDRRNEIIKRDELVNKTAQRWAKTFVEYSKSNVNIIGEDNIPKDKAVVFIGNHQSIFDIPILLGYMNKSVAFIAKIETSRYPIINKWMKYMNCVFLDRNNIRQSLRTINQGVENIKQGYSYVIFPEGTRTKNGELASFKPGSFKLAIKADAQIVPVTIKNSYQIMEKKKFRVKKATVDVVFSQSIDTHDFDKRDTIKLANEVREIINKELIS